MRRSWVPMRSPYDRQTALKLLVHSDNRYSPPCDWYRCQAGKYERMAALQ